MFLGHAVLDVLLWNESVAFPVDVLLKQCVGGFSGAAIATAAARRGLSELLQAMDIAAEARILTLASTNDAATLALGCVEVSRFDSTFLVTNGHRNALRCRDG